MFRCAAGPQLPTPESSAVALSPLSSWTRSATIILDTGVAICVVLRHRAAGGHLQGGLSVEMVMDPPLVAATDLGRRHPDGRRWLLGHVTFELRPGERWSIAGPSGAGKTLLLRALALLDPVDSGQVRWKGGKVAREATAGYRSKVIYLHQRPVMLGDTVEAALRRPLMLGTHRGRHFRPDLVEDWLGELGRDKSFLDQTTANLSGGEQQIVALLRALALDPSVLLLDEPTAAMDPKTTQAVEAMLNRWIGEAGDSRALVWVTHDADQAHRVTGRMLSMESGRIL